MPLKLVAVQVVVLMFCINADGADTADNALSPLTVAEVADNLPTRDEVELKSVNLAETPLIAAEDTLVAADTFVAEIFKMNAEGAETADNALKPLTNPDVPDIVTPSDDVALKSVNLPEVALTAAADTDVVNLASGDDKVVELTLPALKLVRAEIFVPLIVGESAEVELKSVNLADTPLISAALTSKALTSLAAEMFVPDIVTPKDEVALKSTTLVAAEKLTAPVTVPPDRGKYAPPPPAGAL